VLSRLGFVPMLVVFLLVGNTAALAAGTFSDDDGNTHEANIEAIAAEGITRGCDPPANTRYCPSSAVSRGAMAAFLGRALGLKDAGDKDWFEDDNGHLFERDINRLAAAGITKGCNPPSNDRFCPDDTVTRGEMAAFLVRAFGYSTGGGKDLFVDDDGSTFETDIDRLATAGVTKGCNPPGNDRFCARDVVARDTMASFLARALKLDPIQPVGGQSYLFGPHIGGAGDWGILDDQFTGAHFSPTTPSKAISILKAAQADGKSVILLLARSGSHYQNADGTFSMAKWKEAIDQYASMDFTPYIEDGTFLAHYLVSEPMAKNSWGGKVITAPELDQMARYSKQYWPDLTAVVREHPTDLISHAGGKGVPLPNWSWTYLDAAWARYSAHKGPIEGFIKEEVAAAKAKHLGLLFGMNVLHGGSGGGNMTVGELLDYGPKLIAEPYGCATLMWHYDQSGGDAYFARADVDAAMAQMAQQARNRPPGNCLPH
jgi:hypothetical protein